MMKRKKVPLIIYPNDWRYKHVAKYLQHLKQPKKPRSINPIDWLEYGITSLVDAGLNRIKKPR